MKRNTPSREPTDPAPPGRPARRAAPARGEPRQGAPRRAAAGHAPSPGRPPGDAPPPDEATRERLLAAARELFTARGFRGTSTRAIASRAGCNLSLIKYYFGSKEGLLHEVMQPALNKVRFLIERMGAEMPPTPGRIREFIEALALEVDAHRQLFRLVFAELMREESPLAPRLEPSIGLNQQAGLRALQRAGDAGLLREVDLRVALLMVMSPLVFYHLAYPLVSGFVGPRSPDRVRELAAGVADIFLHGVLAPAPVPPREVPG